MTIKFKIEYHTRWGQQLLMVGSTEEMGKWERDKALPMIHEGNGNWTCELEIKKKETKDFSYQYLLREGEHELVEWGEPRSLDIEASKIKSLEIIDHWRSRKELEHVFFSSAFTKILFARKKKKKLRRKKADLFTHYFRLEAPKIDKRYHFCILGSEKSLGNWNPKKAMILDDRHYPIWEVGVKISRKTTRIEYKYGIYDTHSDELIAWESGKNRVLDIKRKPDSKDPVIYNDLHFNYDDSPWKGAGVAIPVFSLRSKNGYGVGEFKDLKLLINWAAQSGLKLIQILPINDTVATHTWKDSYPYAAISVTALHPIYLHLPAMGKVKNKLEMRRFEIEGEKLNALDQIDYEAVMALKSKYYKIIYDQERDKFLKDSDFLRFFKDNEDWLVPYAAFSCLRDRYKTADFSKWKEFAQYDQNQIAKLVDPKNKDYDDYAVHYFIQYHLDMQLSEVVAYAKKKGVVIKGDIPIGIFRHSVDAWMYPHLFNMDKQAGAPPDDFSIKGQNWGFPTYNWEEMAKDGYRWWKERLLKMSNYFDAYRIDHILGFFRIWEIPEEHVEGLMGYFNPAIPLYEYEIQGNGVQFEPERYCKPWIQEHMLDELFGVWKEEVKEKYLNSIGENRYEIKSHYKSQRKIAGSLKIFKKDTEEDRIRKERLKDGLFELIGNYIFLEDPTTRGEGFHPKIRLQFTRSFNELNNDEKLGINRLYNHYFYERQEHFWREKAMVKLPAIISATKMLVCGEDLGMVPDCVPGVMEELGILSLEIQRMPKDPNKRFSNPNDGNYLSVCSSSSHDMSTIRGWWEEDREEIQLFFNRELGLHGEAPYYCEPWICAEIVNQHLRSPAMWTILPIQDYISLDGALRNEDTQGERINVPSNPQHYWRYRLHVNLEELIEKKDFNTTLKEMIHQSGKELNAILNTQFEIRQKAATTLR